MIFLLLSSVGVQASIRQGVIPIQRHKSNGGRPVIITADIWRQATSDGGDLDQIAKEDVAIVRQVLSS